MHLRGEAVSFFVISPEIKALIAKQVEIAARKENWYRPFDPNYEIPGDVPGGKVHVGSYTVVFTWTVDKDKTGVFRHMSVRAPNQKYPPPVVVFTLAHWCGFTGAKPDSSGLVDRACTDWAVAVNEQERTIVVGQKVEGVQP